MFNEKFFVVTPNGQREVFYPSFATILDAVEGLEDDSCQVFVYHYFSYPEDNGTVRHIYHYHPHTTRKLFPIKKTKWKKELKGLPQYL